ncbi:MAG: glutathione S-transferase [Pseudomonadota bacterium]
MILVHHLRIGRSIFTVWLLEELGLEYELKIYDRNPETFRAPPELKKAHPLGKSPVIEIDGMTIAESGAIATYLVGKFDKETRLAPASSDEKAYTQYLQWLHYTEASAFAPLLMRLLLSREPDPKPKVFEAFSSAEVTLQLDYVAKQLGDNDFILGDRLQTPDFGMTYICEMAGRFGLLEGYPTLKAYLERNQARPAFQRAKEKTGG